MARGPRISFPGAVFHVLNRFIDRHPFFQRDEDYERFLEIFFEEADCFQVSVYAYDLLPNHFHILLETRNGDISSFLQRFLTRVAQDLNRSMGRNGRVFQGRTKTLLIDSDHYFDTVMAYVLLNRVRAGLAPSLFSDEWNSVGELLTRSASKLDRERLWPYLFGRELRRSKFDFEIGACRKWLKSLDISANLQLFRDGHRGSFLGSGDFRARILQDFERRQIRVKSTRRRKLDRSRPLDNISLVKRASRRISDDYDLSTYGWKNDEIARVHIEWYLLFTEAKWQLERIRAAYLPDGSGHSRISMAIRKIREHGDKRHVAEEARCRLTDVIA